MIKTMAVVLFLLMAKSASTKECFNFDNIFLSNESKEEVTEKLLNLKKLLGRFFYLRGELDLENISSVPWSTARELAYFLKSRGFDITVREEFYNEYKESYFRAWLLAALTGGYALGSYLVPYEKKLLEKIIVRRKIIFVAGVLWRIGAVGSAWLGGGYIFDGHCRLLFSSSLFGGALPLMNLEINEMPPSTDTGTYEDAIF